MKTEFSISMPGTQNKKHVTNEVIVSLIWKEPLKDRNRALAQVFVRISYLAIYLVSFDTSEANSQNPVQPIFSFQMHFH